MLALLLFIKLPIMFGLFKKKSKLEELQDKYKKLLEESYQLSHSNRKLADTKTAEAETILKEIEKLQAK
jgi:hypothetical protein